MSSRNVHTNHDHLLSQAWHAEHKPPYNIRIKAGVDRSLDQNRLAFKWYGEIAEQLGDMSLESYRAHCKLHFGVPIRREDDDYREGYDRVIRPMDYEDKLKVMGTPLDFPVTRDMTTKQMSRYLDAIYTEFTGRGVLLTTPD